MTPADAPSSTVPPVIKKNFEGLDTLRTLLALGVALGHYFYWNGTSTYYPWSFFLAVDFFFVLSGFVLAQSILANKAPNTESFLRGFAIRRVFRLVPLYLFLLPLCALIIIARHGLHADPFYYFAYSALLLQAMGFDAGATHIFSDTTIGIAWSISVELWVGLLYFPLVYRLRAAPIQLIFLSSFIAILCLALLVNFSPNTLNVNLQRFAGIFTFGAIRGLLGFSIGTICFLTYRALSGLRLSKVKATLAEILLITFFGLLYVKSNYNHQNEFVAPFLFFFVILLVALGSGKVTHILSLPLWKSVRQLSYAIYLIHPFYISIWRGLHIPFNHRLSFLYLGLILITASLLHKMIERPGIEMGHRVLKDLERKAPL